MKIIQSELQNIKLYFSQFFRKFERWTWNGTDFNKEESDESLTGYYAYPEAFLVKKDYCS